MDTNSPEKRTDVVICSGDLISGVTSWAFRIRKALANHPRFKVHILNCLNETQTVGNFEAITPDAQSFKDYLEPIDAPIVIPNYFWNLFETCRRLRKEGKKLSLIGYCRSDSTNEYYTPLSQVEDILSHIIAVSPVCSNKLQAILKNPSFPITVLPTGIDVPETLDRKWQTGPLRIAYGGRIEQAQKRVEDLVPLLEELYRLDIDFALSIAGAGRPIKTLSEALKKRDIENRVKIRGKLRPEEMPSYWGEHDIMLSLSAYEGTSNSMLEAMAKGCVPIVSETESGTDGIIIQGKTGLTFPIGNTRHLASLIANLSLEQIQRLGIAAHNKSGAFSIQTHISVFERILNYCIRDRASA